MMTADISIVDALVGLRHDLMDPSADSLAAWMMLADVIEDQPGPFHAAEEDEYPIGRTIEAHALATIIRDDVRECIVARSDAGYRRCRIYTYFRHGRWVIGVEETNRPERRWQVAVTPRVWTMADIRTAMTEAGSLWFSPSALRFFQSRIGKVFQGPGGIYFISSEVPPHGPRRYSVRHFDPIGMKVKTFGEFCTMTKREAEKSARQGATSDPRTISPHLSEGNE